MKVSEADRSEQSCVIIGASHAGVGCAFSLRSMGWAGRIVLIDSDPEVPYHRPPLSKQYLASDEGGHQPLRAAESYDDQRIELVLGVRVAAIDRDHSHLLLDDERTVVYDKLVLATGARPFIPPIPGLEGAKHVYPIRSAADVAQIRAALRGSIQQRVVIIGGGYIGLETAASLRKLGACVTVIEREDRVLARVTTPEMSDFFSHLHAINGVEILTGKRVSRLTEEADEVSVICEDGTTYPADLVIVGVGVRVNAELAADAGLEVDIGIRVDHTGRTTDERIYAIGDCTSHYNPHYDRFVRLESVQNAGDQASIAAASIVGREVSYDSIPWFWSDQYDTKLQIVGLSAGYDCAVVRQEPGEATKFSIWYFSGDRLLAVDAVDNAKAYVIGTKMIKTGMVVDRKKLADSNVVLRISDITVGE